MEAIEPQSSRRLDHWPALLILFLWFGLVVLTDAGNAAALEVREAGWFLTAGLGAIGLAACLLGFFSGHGARSRAVLLVTQSALALLPCFAIDVSRTERSIFLELYLILLLTIPAFLSYWRSLWQIAASVVVLTASILLWMPRSDWASMHSVLLVLIASVLSVFMLMYREQEARTATFVGRLFERETSSTYALQQNVWNVLFLQAALLLLLLFLDISVFQSPQSPLLCKIYALIILVLGGMLASTCRSSRLPSVLLLVTLLVATFLSLARLGYHDDASFYLILPSIYLIVLGSSLSWSWQHRLMAVWAIPLIDLSLKMLGAAVLLGFSIDSAGFAVQRFRTEIGLIIVSAVGAFIVAVARARTRELNLAAVRSLPADPSVTPTGAVVDQYPVAWNSLGGRLLAQHRQQRLLIALFSLGIISCLTSSRLLATLNSELWYIDVLSWVIFLALWGLLLYGTARKLPAAHLWALGVLVELVLVLWPSMLLIVVPDPGLLWLFWPVAICIGIGAIPWDPREFVTLLLVFAIVGVEVVRHSALGAPGLTGMLTIGIAAAFLHTRSARRMTEREMISTFGAHVRRARDPVEALRMLADYASHMCGAPEVVCVFDDRSELFRLPWFDVLDLDAVDRQQLFADLDIAGSQASDLPDVIPLLLRLSAAFAARLGQSEAQSQALAMRFEVPAPAGRLQRLAVVVLLRGPLPTVFRADERRSLETIARMADARLSQLAGDLQQVSLKEEHERKLAQREYELGALVHDINNTVQDLTLLCESILEHPEGEQLDVLESRVRRIEGIARSVATVVSDAKRKRELERMSDFHPREFVQVGEVLEELLEFARLRAERKRISVSPLELPDEALWVKVSVREHLETILRNLLNNAVAYSQSGTTIEVNLRYDAQTVWIEVRDNGAGLRPEEAEAIFEVGVRGRQGQDVRGGLGLGLAVSRRVAESAGGTLTVFSEGVGRGSTFTLSLPRHNAPVTGVQGAPWALLVDDEPPIVDFYERLARGLDLVPYSASSVSEAMALLAEHGVPKFVITDVHLGASDGFDLVQHLRSVYGNSIPILVISGLHGDDIAERARLAGATDFVQKPVSRRVLFARIQSLLPS